MISLDKLERTFRDCCGVVVSRSRRSLVKRTPSASLFKAPQGKWSKLFTLQLSNHDLLACGQISRGSFLKNRSRTCCSGDCEHTTLESEDVHRGEKRVQGVGTYRTT